MSGRGALHWEERLTADEVWGVNAVCLRLRGGRLDADGAYEELVALGLTAEEADAMVSLEEEC